MSQMLEVTWCVYDSDSIELDPEDFIDCENLSELIDAVDRIAEEQIPHGASDVDWDCSYTTLWDEVEALRIDRGLAEADEDDEDGDEGVDPIW